MGWSYVEKIGLKYVVSLGNKSILNENDFLDLDSKCLIFYLEDFKKGEEFLKKKPNKPIIIIKGGKSKRGKLAALSHTGAMIGDFKVEKDILEEHKIYVAENILEAFDVAKATLLPKPKINKLLIITNGGGLGVLFTDLCENIEFLDKTEKFKEVVPEFGSYKNPIDLTGSATIENYKKALEIAKEIKPITVLLFCETQIIDPMELAKLIVNYNDIPLIVSMLGGDKVYKALDYLKENRIFVTDNLLRAYYGVKGILYHSLF